MEYKILDMQTYKRKAHFEYFRSLPYPYVGTTPWRTVCRSQRSIRIWSSRSACLQKAENKKPGTRKCQVLFMFVILKWDQSFLRRKSGMSIGISTFSAARGFRKLGCSGSTG